LNTTEVGTGRRRVFAPFRFSGIDLQFFAPSVASRVRVSTAAVLSARFPGMTPAGWFESEEHQGKVSFVDGGYFESSGASTALELYQTIERQFPAVDLKMIVLTFDKPKFYDYAELGDTVRTLLNTGVSRALLAVRAAERHISGEEADGTCTPSGKLLKVELTEQLYPLPLGWKWSDATRFLVRTQKGNAEEGAPRADASATAGEQQYTADCVAWHVRRQIEGGRTQQPAAVAPSRSQ
jgi:hypothetical protein